MAVEFGEACAPFDVRRRCLGGRAAGIGGVAQAGAGKLVAGQFQARGLGEAKRGRVHENLESGSASGGLCGLSLLPAPSIYFSGYSGREKKALISGYVDSVGQARKLGFGGARFARPRIGAGAGGDRVRSGCRVCDDRRGTPPGERQLRRARRCVAAIRTRVLFQHMPDAQSDKGRVEPFEFRHHLAQRGYVVAGRVRENRVAQLLGGTCVLDGGLQVAQTRESMPLSRGRRGSTATGSANASRTCRPTRNSTARRSASARTAARCRKDAGRRRPHRGSIRPGRARTPISRRRWSTKSRWPSAGALWRVRIKGIGCALLLAPAGRFASPRGREVHKDRLSGRHEAYRDIRQDITKGGLCVDRGRCKGRRR